MEINGIEVEVSKKFLKDVPNSWHTTGRDGEEYLVASDGFDFEGIKRSGVRIQLMEPGCYPGNTLMSAGGASPPRSSFEGDN